jgi:predicted ATPase/DNA-binding XRE family transcriptional regulator
MTGTLMAPLLAGARNPWDPRRIAGLREQRGWTQEELAERSGLSVRTIRNLELGVVQNPRRSSLGLLAEALGMRVEEAPEHPHAEPPGPARWRGPRPPATGLVGDPAEHERAARTVATHRFTTLVGPGGIGKTRLALHVAAGIGDCFRHGVAVVELGDLAAEGGATASQAAAVLARVRRQLRWCGTGPDGDDEPQVLLVLDNAEHVPDGVTTVARELLDTHPGMRIICTARRRITERLGANLQVRPLPTAAAVELVLRHAGLDAVAPAEAAEVAELCRRLGGLPRYLEFAAERLRAVSVRRLLAYRPLLEMLCSHDHALLAHQRSVAGSIRWDVDLLGAAHGRLLARIAALPGPWFTGEEAAADDRRGTGVNPLALLSDLVETSLIVADPDDRYRYRLAPFVADTVHRARAEHAELARWRTAVAS